MFRRRYRWNNTLADSIAYSLVAAVGLYTLIAWLLNAANDIYVLLFHSDPYLVAVTLELWNSTIGYLMLSIFIVLFFILRAETFWILKTFSLCMQVLYSTYATLKM